MTALALDALTIIQPFVYGTLTLVAFLQWRRHRGSAGAWLFVGLAVLAVVLAALRWLPEDSDSALVQWAGRATVASLVLFPYSLFRFMRSFVHSARWVEVGAAGLTILVAGASFLLPEDGAQWWLQAYILALLVQWLALSGIVAVRLWLAGRAQPSVARGRMRTMSLAAIGLSLAVAVGSQFSYDGGPALVSNLLALVAAPLLLIGFSPPYVFRVWWRRDEEVAASEAERSLMEATSTSEVASTLLPHARRLVGAAAAILETEDGELIASDEAADGQGGTRAGHPRPTWSDGSHGPVLSIPMRGHRLTILATPFTPFFGREEISRLETVAQLADLALARNALLENQRLLAAIVESSGEAIIAEALDETITSWNTAAQTLFGYSSEEVAGRHGSMLLPAGFESDVPDILEKVRAGRNIENYETKRRTKAGQVLDVALSVSPLYDSTGAIVGASTIARDVTERKEVERRLRASEKQLSAAQRIAGLGSWHWNIDTDEITWSAELYRIFGASPAHHDPSSDRFGGVHPDDRARVEAVTEQAMASREPFTIEYRVIRPDGSERTVEARGDVELVSGRAVGVSGTIQDITARRTVERERELARAEAERANRAKNDFLSRMSHELRTPLNSVLGFAQLLQMDPLTPEQREQTSEIMRAGKHLLELINEVLDIAAIEAGRLQLSMEPVDAVGVARECVSLLTPLANAEEVTLGLQTAGLEGSSHHVAADQQRLKQVLLNLIANGIKYNRKNGHVALAFHPIDGGRHLRIDVTDTGHGISKDRLEKLFLPFERLGAEASGIEGTGLGLALSKSLTEAMGGVLSVTSDQGEGTTFSIDLASAEPALATAGREMPVAAETTAVRSASRTVLYIEDNLSNLRLVEGLISRRPKVSLMTAMQGSVGLVLARDHVPDLILLDLNLPDVSGEEVLLRLLSDPQTAEIPVVVLSADATKGQVKRLLDAGARAYLTKPIDVATFYEVLDEHCAEPVT